MKTVQIYRTGDSCANTSSPVVQNTTPAAKSGVLLIQDYKPRISFILSGGFGDQLANPHQVQAMRESIRAWFMTWIPRWEEQPGSGLTEAIWLYQYLDEFLSDMSMAILEDQAKND
ncbi:hypothetical protein G8759_06205 [Spirosoma aureum]|uniref:Uncharacterized protein n=1 Tax=Spirosoma aureum TaxID=2692134 RepID=A0A6G9AIV2_9BACT|nr:hypothetical protein [Spirosoma aureum]QIP12249.1 hypothetical protein G8759_06205 [Spirosoma aureum]